MTNFTDIVEFHEKFGLEYDGPPRLMNQKMADFRIKFLKEELQEFIDSVEDDDLLGATDALVDLVYVAMGTAYLMGIPWEAAWNAVQQANMTKVRAEHAGESKRNTTLDVIKPPGWVGPEAKLVKILMAAGYEHVPR